MEEKLIRAFDNHDIDKMNKYLILGAPANVNDNTLYYECIDEDRINELSLLLKYYHNNDDNLLDRLIRYCCDFKKVDCLKCLMPYINLNDYRQTDTLDVINELLFPIS